MQVSRWHRHPKRDPSTLRSKGPRAVHPDTWPGPDSARSERLEVQSHPIQLKKKIVESYILLYIYVYIIYISDIYTVSCFHVLVIYIYT